MVKCDFVDCKRTQNVLSYGKLFLLFSDLKISSHCHWKMELTRKNFRAMIDFDFRRGLSQEQCIDRLTLTLGDEGPSNPTVFHGFQ